MSKNFFVLYLIESYEAVLKIQAVILSEAKNLIFFLLNPKNQKRDPSAFGLSMTRKDKFTKILEHSLLKHIDR
jgi:hypothetical protein